MQHLSMHAIVLKNFMRETGSYIVATGRASLIMVQNNAVCSLKAQSKSLQGGFLHDPF